MKVILDYDPETMSLEAHGIHIASAVAFNHSASEVKESDAKPAPETLVELIKLGLQAEDLVTLKTKGLL